MIIVTRSKVKFLNIKLEEAITNIEESLNEKKDLIIKAIEIADKDCVLDTDVEKQVLINKLNDEFEKLKNKQLEDDEQ